MLIELIHWFCTAIVTLQIFTIARDIIGARIDRALDEAIDLISKDIKDGARR